MISLLIKYGEVDLAIEKAISWLSDHPDDTIIRTRYIGLVEQTGTPDQVENIISETKTLPDDSIEIKKLQF